MLLIGFSKGKRKLLPCCELPFGFNRWGHKSVGVSALTLRRWARGFPCGREEGRKEGGKGKGSWGQPSVSELRLAELRAPQGRAGFGVSRPQPRHSLWTGLWRSPSHGRPWGLSTSVSRLSPHLPLARPGLPCRRFPLIALLTPPPCGRLKHASLSVHTHPTHGAAGRWVGGSSWV